MIGYVTLGTNDLQRAATFYDVLLAEFGAKRFMETERYIFWAAGRGQPAVAVMMPFDGNPATIGNGVMVALAADSRASVDRVHAKALELGATDEGAVGMRGDIVYAGYFRDPDGNKLNVFYMG